MSDARNGTARWLAGLALGAALAASAGAGPAQAQPFFGVFGYRSYEVPAMLSPELVYRHLMRTGYQPIGRIQRNGRVFLADVIDSRRRQLRLVIDSFDGTILERYVIAGRTPDRLDERIARPSAPMADPNLPPPRLLPAPSARPDRDAAGKSARPSTAARAPTPDRGPQRNRAAVAPDAGREAPKAKAEAEPQTETAEAASAPAAAPASPPARARRSPPSAAPKVEGPGYANGVPINPLD